MTGKPHSPQHRVEQGGRQCVIETLLFSLRLSESTWRQPVGGGGKKKTIIMG